MLFDIEIHCVRRGVEGGNADETNYFSARNHAVDFMENQIVENQKINRDCLVEIMILNLCSLNARHLFADFSGLNCQLNEHFFFDKYEEKSTISQMDFITNKIFRLFYLNDSYFKLKLDLKC